MSAQCTARALYCPRCTAHALQVEAFDTSLDLYGSLAFLLWRSVYITKQVRLAVLRLCCGCAVCIWCCIYVAYNKKEDARINALISYISCTPEEWECRD